MVATDKSVTCTKYGGPYLDKGEASPIKHSWSVNLSCKYDRLTLVDFKVLKYYCVSSTK